MARGKNFMRAFTTDMRYALRSLTRAPGFVAVSVITLGRDIGGVTAMYSLLYGSIRRTRCVRYEAAGAPDTVLRWPTAAP